MNRFTTSDGLSLAYRDEGTGTPVIALAGLTRNANDFNDMMPHVPDGFRIVRLDYRGRGASDHDANHLNYSIPVEARDVVELMDHLGFADTAFIGTSRGGLISMVLAATVPDRVRGVLLNDIGPELEPAGLERIMGYLGQDPGFADYDEAVIELARLNANTFPGVSPKQWRAAAERWWDATPDGLRINYDPKLRDAVIELSAEPAPDMWPLFEALADKPVALIRGANSDLLGTDCVNKMLTRRPDMVFADVPGRAHVPFLDEPQSVDVIHKFLASLPE